MSERDRERILITIAFQVTVHHVYPAEALHTTAPPPKLLEEHDQAVELKHDNKTDRWSTKE
jgi:hypothetical protein